VRWMLSAGEPGRPASSSSIAAGTAERIFDVRTDGADLPWLTHGAAVQRAARTESSCRKPKGAPLLLTVVPFGPPTLSSGVQPVLGEPADLGCVKTLD